MSSLALNLSSLPSANTVKVMNIGEDGHDFDLFKTFPFFIDVLEWLEGTRPYQNIRHTFTEGEFRKSILPTLLKRLQSERLIRSEHGHLTPTHDAVVLKNMPRDPWIHCEMAANQLDGTLKRCLDERRAPDFEMARTKAKPEKIADWSRQLRNLLAEIDDHDDPCGVPFSLSALSVAAN